MTRAIIFDLDTFLAAADEVGEQLFAQAFAAIRAAKDGSVTEVKTCLKTMDGTGLRIATWTGPRAILINSPGVNCPCPHCIARKDV